MILKRLLTLTLLFGSFILTAQKIPFQGKLTENDEPVTGSRDFTFTFESANWTETHTGVAVLDGFYSVVLGSNTPIPDSLFDKSDQVQLGITVGETALSPITVYAPFGAKTGRFVITETTDTSTVALNVYNNSTGTTFGTGSRIGAYIEAAGDGLNTGIFTYAENGRSINNQTEITDPQVYGLSQLASLYGYTDVGGRGMQAQYTAAGPGHGVGLSGYAGGGGMNWALWSRANSNGQGTPNDSMQVGAYVEAYGGGSGEHIGLRGIASAENASRNIGVHGIAYNGVNENWAGWFDGDVKINGQLDTLYSPVTVFFDSDQANPTSLSGYSTGFGNGDVSYNTGVRGEASNNPWGNVGVTGWAVGDQGSDNSGASFFAQIDNGSDSISNTGVYLQANSPAKNFGARANVFGGIENTGGDFRATGPGRNIGVYGLAENGSENWAGWFDGDVNVNGQLLVNGQNLAGTTQYTDSIESRDIKILNPDGVLKAHLNYYEPNNAGSLVLYGASDTTRTAILGSSGITGGNSGLLYLYDQFDQAKAQLRVDTLSGGADDFGTLRLFNSDYSSMLYLDGSSGTGSFPGDLNVGGDIFVNGESISNTDSIVAKDIQLLDTAGRMRAHLNIFDTNAGSLVLNGPNDSTNVILGASNNGYDGSLYLYDSLRNNGVRLQSRGVGGFMQLARYNNETSAYESAVVASANNSNSFLSMYGQNSTADGVTLMIDNYINANQIGVGNTDPLLNGYRRSGTDWKANDNRVYAAIGNAGTESGDESGFSGYLSLWGTSTYNAQLTGKRWENNDLPIFELYGTNDDGSGWFQSNFLVALDTADGNISYANLGMKNTVNGGGNTETLFMTSNFNGGGYSYVEMRDSVGSNTIVMNGGNGNIDVNGQVTAGGVALSSDKRYKRDIATLDNALANTRKLRGTSYFWKDAKKGTDRQIGVIAQEVEKVYPEFVHTNENGYKSVNYSQMVAVLIEAVKELDAKVANLEAENSELKAELASKESDDIESLRSEIESIKRMLTSPAVEQSGTVGQDR